MARIFSLRRSNASGEWPRRGREAALALSGEVEEASRLALLLTDIRMIFEETGWDRTASADLCERLAAMENRPWPELGRSKNRITPAALARLLGPLGVRPNTIRVGEATPKGYMKADFNDAFLRYLRDPPSQSATPPQALFLRGSGGL